MIAYQAMMCINATNFYGKGAFGDTVRLLTKLDETRVFLARQTMRVFSITH